MGTTSSMDYNSERGFYEDYVKNRNYEVNNILKTTKMLLTQLFAPQRNEFARHFPLFIMTEISVCSASELIMIISYNAEVHKSKKSKTTSTLFKKVTLWTFD